MNKPREDVQGPVPAEDASTVDRQHPWLGLASFTEETRSYFHGREEEVAELARRVQRKLLTILFGQSGLGKTSILRAGLVPRAAPRGLLPGLRAHRLLARVAAALRADQAGDLPRDAGLGDVDAVRRGRRGRVAVGVPAPPRRRAARTPTGARSCRSSSSTSSRRSSPSRRATTSGASAPRSSSPTSPTWSRTGRPGRSRRGSTRTTARSTASTSRAPTTAS